MFQKTFKYLHLAVAILSMGTLIGNAFSANSGFFSIASSAIREDLKIDRGDLPIFEPHLPIPDEPKPILPPEEPKPKPEEPKPEDCSQPRLFLQGSILTNGANNGQATAQVTNNARTCELKVSFSSYQMFIPRPQPGWLSTQVLFDSVTVTLKPGEGAGADKLHISVPDCAYQIDLYAGDKISSLNNDIRHPAELLIAYDFGKEDNLCGPKAKPDFSISKEVDNKEPFEGDTITYTITAINTGKANVTGVVISDRLPDGITYITSESSLPATFYNPSLGRMDLVGLDSGASVTLTIRASINQDTAGRTINNTATVSSADLSKTANVSMVVQQGKPKPKPEDCSQPKQFLDGSIISNGKDNGTATAQITNISKTCTLKASFSSYKMFIRRPREGWLSTQVLFDSVTVTLKPAESAGADKLRISVPDCAYQIDLYAGDRISSLNGTGHPPELLIAYDFGREQQLCIRQSGQSDKVDLSVSKVVDNSRPFEGDTINYTLAARNISNHNATGVVLHDSLPDGLTFVSSESSRPATVYNPTSGDLNLTSLDTGAVVTLTIRARINQGTAGRTITNSADISSREEDSNPSNNHANVSITVQQRSGGGGGGCFNCGGGEGSPFAQLRITKLAKKLNSQDAFAKNVSALSGDRVAFQIILVSSGTITANNVYINDTLLNGLNLVADTLKLNGNLVSSGVGSRLNLGAMAPDQQHIFYFETTVNSDPGTTLRNIAQASADNTATVVDDANVLVTSVLGSNIALNLSKSAFNDTKNIDATAVVAEQEDFITYTLTAANSGNANATNFVISDDLSKVLNYSTLVTLDGGSLDGNVISWPALTVPAGGSVQKIFRVRINPFLPVNVGNYTLINTYGNSLTISVAAPQVLGTSIKLVAPRTGSEAGSAILFAGTLTAAFAFAKRRYSAKLKNFLDGIRNV